MDLGNYHVPWTSPLSSRVLFRVGFHVSLYRFFILVISAIVLGLLLFVFLKTRIGYPDPRRGLGRPDGQRPWSQCPQAVPGGVLRGAALAGLAGVVAGPFLSTYPGMGLDMMVDTFVVVVVGGFGSLLGAFIASLMIGELQSFGVLFIPRLALVFSFS